MHARALPIRNIAITLFLLALVSLTAQFFGWRALHGVALLACFIAIASMLGYHAWIDNSRTTYRNFNSSKTFGLAVLVWMPFLLLLLPGILATLWIDDQIDATLRWAEKKASGTVETVERHLVDTIQESEAIPWSWYWPPHWFQEGTRIVERKVMRTVQEDILHPAPIWIRSVFALIYAIMRVSQLVLYSSIAFIVIRSFVFLLARAALLSRSEIEFSIP